MMSAAAVPAPAEAHPPSMLEDTRGTRLPGVEELDRVWAALYAAGRPVEHLAMSITYLTGPNGPVASELPQMTAEQAWHLTDFARSLRLNAEELACQADEIEMSVESLYQEARNA